MAWKSVKVSAPANTEFAVVSDEDQMFHLALRNPGEEWPDDVVKTTSVSGKFPGEGLAILFTKQSEISVPFEVLEKVLDTCIPVIDRCMRETNYEKLNEALIALNSLSHFVPGKENR